MIQLLTRKVRVHLDTQTDASFFSCDPETNQIKPYWKTSKSSICTMIRRGTRSEEASRDISEDAQVFLFEKPV